MKDAITEETVVLGMRLASIQEYLRPDGLLGRHDMQRMLDDHEQLSAVFQRCPQFMQFCHEAHVLLAHTAAADNCTLGRLSLFALLSKCFWAGWAACRQELIDEQVKAMEPK